MAASGTASNSSARSGSSRRRAVQVPANLPDGFPKSNIAGSGCYGFNWWVNGVKPERQAQVAGRDREDVRRAGAQQQPAAHRPESQLVIVRLGLDQADRKIGDGEIGEFLKRIGSAIAG